MSKVPKFQFEDCPPAKLAKPAKHPPDEASTLATLSGGENENQLFHIQDEIPQASPRERILTCADCPRHEQDRINPPEGWGRCTLKKRGCYGLRPACSEIPRDTWDG